MIFVEDIVSEGIRSVRAVHMSPMCFLVNRVQYICATRRVWVIMCAL